MERVIRLRSLLECMSQPEYAKFIEHIAGDKDQFTALLCDIAISALSPSYLPSEPLCLSHFDAINRTASEILKSRTQIAECNPFANVQELPDEILCSIGLFLPLPDQSRFALCSKNVFLSMREAKTLIRRLDEQSAGLCAELSSMYTATCWNVAERLQRLEHLELDLCHSESCHFCMTDQIPVTSLKLLNYSHPLGAEFFENNPDLSQITSLELDERDWSHYKFQVIRDPLEVVLEALSNCSKLESLSLGTCGTEIAAGDLAVNVAEMECLRSLRVFCAHHFHPDLVGHQMLLEHGRRLESVHLHHSEGPFAWRSRIGMAQCVYDLSNLQEICVGSGREPEDLEILIWSLGQSENDCLKRIRLESAGDYWSNVQNGQSVENGPQRVDERVVELLSRDSIEYIELSARDIACLSEVAKVRRPRLKVRVHTINDAEEVVTERLLEILEVMSQSVADWMFIAAIRATEESEDRCGNGGCAVVMQSLNRLYAVTTDDGYRQIGDEQEGTLSLLAVSPKKGPTMRYDEEWIQRCKVCQKSVYC